MPREKMLREMSGSELRDWEVYNAVIGLGDTVELIGAVCSLVASLGGVKDASAADYHRYLKADRDALDAEQTPEEMLARLTKIASASIKGL